MKLESQNEQVFGSNSARTTFTIGASAKAFQILSSGIYKNKIRAVAREVICNAVDAHMLNGTAKRFEIKPPSEIDPRFIVTDFGPGLSKESMLEIYTQYFASTKNGGEIGGFGLGAKSPFSYTDTFSVESRHCGIVRTYTAMIVNGQPEMTMTYEGQMSDLEHSGVTVTVPVKLNDIYEWEKEIAYILRPFPKSSYDVGSLSVESLEDIDGYNSNWFGTNKTFGSDGDGLYAVYGNIVYPLDRTPGLDAKWLGSKFRTVYVHFDTNTLMPQPSREELQDDEVTVKNIIDRISKLDSDLMEADLNHLDNIKHPRQLARAVNNLAPRQYSILESKGTLIKGKNVHQLTTFEPSVFEPITKLINGHNTIRVFVETRSSIVSRPVFNDTPSYYRSMRNKILVNSPTLFNFKQEKSTIVIDDMKGKHLRTTLKGMLNYSQDFRYRGIIVVDTLDPEKDALIDEVKRLMDGDKVEVLKLSEMDEYRKLVPGYGVKRERSDSVRPKYPNAVLYKKTHDGYRTEELFMSNDDISEYEGLVVGMFGNSDIKALSKDFNFVNGADKYTIINFLFSRSEYEKILFVRPSIYKKIAKNANCICALDELTTLTVDLIESINPDEYVLPNAHTTFDKNIRIHKELQFIHGLIDVTYDIDTGRKIADIDKIMSSIFYNEEPAKSAVEKFKLLKIETDKRYKENVAKFKADNPLVSYALDNSGLREVIIKAIVKQLNP